MIEELSRVLDDVEIEIITYNPPTFSGSDSEFYRLISDSLREFMGDAPLLPCVCSGATDSRFLRKVGVPCYGIEIMTLDLDPSMRQCVHGKDEKIDTESLKLKRDFLVKLARRYLGDSN